jgi:SPP1 family phage portal protein
VDRFSNAYMVLKNISLSAQDAKKIKEVRVFDNVSEDAAVEILTKDIPHGYFQYLSEYYRREIHKQSHVPNFIEDATGGQLSGVAIDKLLYDFEFIAATKEQLFREGLRRRMQLINTILRKTKGDLGDESEIDIHFQRNKPQNMKENAEIINLLMGIITKETLINEYVPFVSDARAEIEKVEEEEDVFGRETNLEAARPST